MNRHNIIEALRALLAGVLPARPPASSTQPGTSSLNGTTMTNRTTLAQLREMDAAQAARLPVDHLALLLEEVAALKADAKYLADLLHDALHARYGTPAAAARRAEGKDFGPRAESDQSGSYPAAAK
jgi:hypothetical protein